MYSRRCTVHLVIGLVLLLTDAFVGGSEVRYDVTVRMEPVQPDGYPRSGIVFYHTNGPNPKSPINPGK